MNKKLQIQANEYVKEHGRKKRWHKFVAALTCELSEGGHVHGNSCHEEQSVLCCGKKETDGHSHDSSCYSIEDVLVCTNEKLDHVHDKNCYESRSVLVCTEQECESHHHDKSCYSTERVCVCGLEAQKPHKHTLQCFSNPDADVETESVWKNTFAKVDLTGNWSNDVVAIAKTQLGYTESTRNYTESKQIILQKVNPDGEGLNDAVFNLYKACESTDVGAIGLVITDEGKKETVWGLSLEQNLTSDTAVIDDKSFDGIFYQGSLESGIYYLVEVTAPAGYGLLTEPVVLTVSGKGVTFTYYGESITDSVTGVGEDIYSARIQNTAYHELPETGGEGTLPYTLSGIFLMAAALMYGCKLRCRRERRAR